MPASIPQTVISPRAITSEPGLTSPIITMLPSDVILCPERNVLWIYNVGSFSVSLNDFLKSSRL